MAGRMKERKSVKERQAITLAAVVIVNFIFHPMWIIKKLYLLVALTTVRITS